MMLLLCSLWRFRFDVVSVDHHDTADMVFCDCRGYVSRSNVRLVCYDVFEGRIEVRMSREIKTFPFWLLACFPLWACAVA